MRGSAAADSEQSLEWLRRAQVSFIDQYRCRFEAIANTLAEHASRLRAMGVSADWSGDAAAAFVEFQAKLPPLLEQVAWRYGEAAGALHDYAFHVGGMQAELRQLDAELDHAQRERRRAETAACAPDAPVAVGPDWEAAILHVRRQRAHLAGRFDEVARLCETRIRSACDALDDPTGFHAAARRFGDALHVVTGAIVSIPGMDVIRKVLDELAFALSIAALVPGLNATIAPVLFVAGSALLVIDAAYAYEGKEKWTTVALDALSVATASVTWAAKSGKLGQTALEVSATTTEKAGKTYNAGQTLPKVFTTTTAAERAAIGELQGAARWERLATMRDALRLDVVGVRSWRELRTVVGSPGQLVDEMLEALVPGHGGRELSQFARAFGEGSNVVRMARWKVVLDSADTIALLDEIRKKTPRFGPTESLRWAVERAS